MPPPSMREQRSELLQRLIPVYSKLITASYSSGLAAARKYGPDIMDLAGRLHELVPAKGQLGRLCDALLDVTWDEYVINAKDLNYSHEVAYRESLGAKADVLERLVAVEARWKRELLGEDEGGGDGDDACNGGIFDGDDGSFTDAVSDDGCSGYGSGDGAEEDEEDEEEGEESRLVLLADAMIDASLNFLPVLDPSLTDSEQDMSFPFLATTAAAVALTGTVNVLLRD